MRIRSFIAAASALVLSGLLPAAPLAAQEVSWLLFAALNGASEVPGPGDPGGFGISTVVLTWDELGGYTACFTIAATGLSTPAVAAHIHPGRADVAGPVIVPFEAPGPISSGCVPVETALGYQIAADPEAFYVNVHTSQLPAGAIRGQLMNPMMMDMGM